jgi:hypothetical protein
MNDRLVSFTLMTVLIAFLVGMGLVIHFSRKDDSVEVERHEYNEPPTTEEILTDDRLEDKKPIPFDPELVDSRELGSWRINLSSAVIKLDVPSLKPDRESHYLTLHPSYAAALKFGSRCSRLARTWQASCPTIRQHAGRQGQAVR